jgi:glucose/arabinose dehydrogenase/mono/diheme cytochrome c family protein
MPHRPLRLSASFLLLSACVCLSLSLRLPVPAKAQDLKPQIERGRTLYALNCLICHQITGQGTPGTFPPLANSDYLAQNRDKTILALVQGLSGPITVNGRKYNNAMPPVVLNDNEVADALTYVRQSWGNNLSSIKADDVKKIRSTSEYPTFEKLKEANAYRPLPTPPDGFVLREVTRLTSHGVRLAADPARDSLYILGNAGDIWKVEVKTGNTKQVVWGKNYLVKDKGSPSTVGFAFDQDHHLYVVCNHRDEGPSIITDNVIIYRSTRDEEGEPTDLQPLVSASYPWGIGPFNHGVGHLAFGPDGMLYVGSGSRTDGSEPGPGGKFSTKGEDPLTATIWRIDPKASKPAIEIYARGLRNPYGFCWNDKAEMFATDNGPDADAPEELNQIVQGAHYGFPFQFSDWDKKPYAYTPATPPSLRITRPIANFGPAAGGSPSKPLYTFDPHSSPSGIVFLGNDWPETYRGSFLLGRFGNLLKTPKDAGFDLLQATLKKNAQGIYEGHFKTLLAPLARPVDVVLLPGARAYILEYTRTVTFGGSLGFPGRILELRAEH